MKDKKVYLILAKVVNDIAFVADEGNFTPVNKEHNQEVLEKIKYAHMEWYMDNCSATSGTPVDGRTYNITNAERMKW
jgi:hypothetical protein